MHEKCKQIRYSPSLGYWYAPIETVEQHLHETDFHTSQKEKGISKNWEPVGGEGGSRSVTEGNRSVRQTAIWL